MPRARSKKFDQNKATIVDTARLMFLEHGFGNTSVDGIIQKLDISKGTFYHYFSTKIELLNAVIDTIVGALQEGIVAAIDDQKSSAVDKLNTYFALPAQFRPENRNRMAETFRVWTSDQNVVFRGRMIRKLRETTIPLLCEILRQGVNEHTIDAEDIQETAHLVFDLGVTLRDRLMDEVMREGIGPSNLDAIVRRYGTAIERVLSLPPGSLSVFDLENF